MKMCWKRTLFALWFLSQTLSLALPARIAGIPPVRQAEFLAAETGAPNRAAFKAYIDSLRAAEAARIKAAASQAQMAERGTIMAGTGGRVPFRDAPRVATEYGGNASDWVKMKSSSFTAPNGTKFEVHWVENIVTGQRVEFKTKFP